MWGVFFDGVGIDLFQGVFEVVVDGVVVGGDFYFGWYVGNQEGYVVWFDFCFYQQMFFYWDYFYDWFVGLDYFVVGVDQYGVYLFVYW